MTAPDALVPRLDLSDFTLGQMLRCGLEIRQATKQPRTMEAAAGAIVRHLFEATGRREDGEAACPLVRFYKTHPLSELPLDARLAAEKVGGGSLADGTQCLTLLATAGVEPEWNDRRRSRAHRAIPLVSIEAISRAPMISRLLEQFGVPLARLLGVSSGQDTADAAESKNYEIFYVAEAPGSPYIPAQDFVREYGIKSVVGFGGVLKTGDLFAVILFSRVHVSPESAQRFRTIALDVRSALFRFGNDEVFEVR